MVKTGALKSGTGGVGKASLKFFHGITMRGGFYPPPEEPEVPFALRLTFSLQMRLRCGSQAAPVSAVLCESCRVWKIRAEIAKVLATESKNLKPRFLLDPFQCTMFWKRD